jgi:4-diphosphocytidyl-2-C-methyl-D-erythritol kinase
MYARFSEPAPAKVNLTLRILGRRADGYHDLESLVVFARLADQVTLTLDAPLGLDMDGPTAAAAGEVADNLVLRAARELAGRTDGLRFGRFALTKHIPVAAGLGGGSSDAAAALRLLMRVNGIVRDSGNLLDAARATGADVPVCVGLQSRLMRGIGEVLSRPLRLPRLPALLINPAVRVATKDVFAALRAPPVAGPEAPLAGGSGSANRDMNDTSLGDMSFPQARDDLLELLSRHGNDLEPVALSLYPVIAQALKALRALAGCRLARMSGSGATCFALFDSTRAATAAARVLRAKHPQWWIRAAVLAG